MAKDEAFINRCVRNTLRESGGVAFKIPDPQGAAVYTTVKNPFDGFGAFKEADGRIVPVYWESKWSRELKAFNLKNSLQEHQAEYLEKFGIIENSVCLVPYGVQVKRGEIRVYLFLWEAVSDFFKGIEIDGKVKNSIPAKVLEKLPSAKIDNKTNTFEIKRDLFITKDLLQQFFN